MRYLLLLTDEFRHNKGIFIQILSQLFIFTSESLRLVQFCMVLVYKSSFYKKKFGSSLHFIFQNVILIYLYYFIFYNKHFLDLTLKKNIVNPKYFRKNIKSMVKQCTLSGKFVIICVFCQICWYLYDLGTLAYFLKTSGRSK